MVSGQKKVKRHPEEILRDLARALARHIAEEHHLQEMQDTEAPRIGRTQTRQKEELVQISSSQCGFYRILR